MIDRFGTYPSPDIRECETREISGSCRCPLLCEFYSHELIEVIAEEAGAHVGPEITIEAAQTSMSSTIGSYNRVTTYKWAFVNAFHGHENLNMGMYRWYLIGFIDRCRRNAYAPDTLFFLTTLSLCMKHESERWYPRWLEEEGGWLDEKWKWMDSTGRWYTMGLSMWLWKYGDEEVYWRKANAIHGWFDRRLGGVEDAVEYRVSRNDLEELVSVCETVVGDHGRAEELLPCTSGFFFGSQEYDDYYFEVVERTARELRRLLEQDDCDEFEYFAWW